MTYLIYIILGLAPSIIWLLFFLRKDAHPESNRMIITVFLLAIAIVPFVALAECIPVGLGSQEARCALSPFLKNSFPAPWGSIFSIFLGVVLIEEVAKYLVVRIKVLRSSEFDEPLDAMLYMIIAALGFAAIENILILFQPVQETFLFKRLLSIQEASVIISFRFIGATFLHALCSGTIGYFLARSLFRPSQKGILLFIGFFLATLLHGLFNIFIMKIGDSIIIENNRLVIANPELFNLSIFGLIVILTSLAIFVTLGFQNLKKLASICKIKQCN